MKHLLKTVLLGLFCVFTIASPEIEFTSVPEYGSTGLLYGRVKNLQNPENYKIAPYIKLSTWWTKPSFGTPTVPISSDGTFSANINTHTNDKNAVFIAVFLINSTNSAPQANGAQEIPRSLYTMALAYKMVGRKFTLFFENYWWHVKDSNGAKVGPGDNYFSGNTSLVYLDNSNQLHMTANIQNQNTYCTEVYTESPLGYGYYIYNVKSKVDQIDENLVLGLFTYDPIASTNHYRELDFEFSKWGNKQSTFNSQFVVQPFQNTGNSIRFMMNQGNTPEITCVMMWSATKVEMAIYFGKYGSVASLPNNPFKNYTFVKDIPPEGSANAHINFWRYQNKNPTSNSNEIIISGFKFECLDGKKGRFCESSNGSTFTTSVVLFCFMITILMF